MVYPVPSLFFQVDFSARRSSRAMGPSHAQPKCRARKSPGIEDIREHPGIRSGFVQPANGPGVGVVFCPKCFSSDVRRSHRRGWERWVPFLRSHSCRACGERFLRGARPPFACCPRCGSSEVQVTSRNRAPKGVAITLLRLLGSRSYGCRNCRHHFLDSRRLRSKLEPQLEQAGGSSNTESSN